MRTSWMRVLLALTTILALAGCPSEPQDPQRPDGTPCASLADCNDGQTCGRLAACVDLRCESAQSLEIPCPR